MQVAMMRFKRLKSWIGRKIKGIFKRKKKSTVAAKPIVKVDNILPDYDSFYYFVTANELSIMLSIFASAYIER